MKYLKYLLIAIFFIFLSGLLLYFYSKDYEKTTINNPKVLYVPRGSTKNVVNHFKKEGIKLNTIDYYLIKSYGYPQAGWIDFGKANLSRWEFFYKLTHSKAMGVKFTVIPGETTYNILQNLADRFKLSVTKLHTFYVKLAPYPEGVIFAESYTFYKGIDEEKLIDILLTKSLNIHKKLSMKFLKKYDQKVWFEKYITIASVVQKEAANKKEMPKVAAVVYNRLKKGMKLQMDGTLNYGKYSHKKVTSIMIRDDNSSFNTYKIKGLPPYPVCVVEKSSIKASLFPDKNSYLYFVKKDKNGHHFSKTYAEHKKFIKR